MLYSTLHPPSPSFGSLANFDISRIPDGTGDFRILKDWIEYVCCAPKYNIEKPTDLFKQDFMVASTLAFDLDRENAWDFVPHTQMCSETLWPQALSSYHDHGFDEQEFVAFVTAEGYDLLKFGSSYLRYVRRET